MLLKNGTKVAVLDFDQSAIESFEKNENILNIVCDVTKENEIKRSIEVIKKKYQKIDILINNAENYIVNH